VLFAIKMHIKLNTVYSSKLTVYLKVIRNHAYEQPLWVTT